MTLPSNQCNDGGGCHAQPDLTAVTAEIVVVINPEARVSAARSGPSPIVSKDGGVAIPVRVQNNGYVTAPLQVRLVGVGRQVDLKFDDGPLNGTAHELRLMELNSEGRTDLDVTIAFGIGPGEGDLAGRDRVHLLLRRTVA